MIEHITEDYEPPAALAGLQLSVNATLEERSTRESTEKHLTQRPVQKDKQLQHQGLQSSPAAPSSVMPAQPMGDLLQPKETPGNPLPSYEDATLPFPLTVSFKQTVAASDAATIFPDAPLWTRLLGFTLAREWLHSSGILSTFTIQTTTDLSFEGLDSQVRSRFQQGSHGSPWKRLQWVYLLKGTWLRDDNEETILLERESWEEGRRRLLGMINVRVDLAFCFQSSNLRSDYLPGYGDLFEQEVQSRAAGHNLEGASYDVEAKAAETIAAKGRMRPGSRPHALRKLLSIRRAQRQHT